MARKKAESSEKFSWRLLMALIVVVALCTLVSALLVITFMVGQMQGGEGFVANVFKSRGVAPAMTIKEKTPAKTETGRLKLNLRKGNLEKEALRLQQVTERKGEMQELTGGIQDEFATEVSAERFQWMNVLENKLVTLEAQLGEEEGDVYLDLWKGKYSNLVGVVRSLTDTMELVFYQACGETATERAEKTCFYDENDVYNGMVSYYNGVNAFLDDLDEVIVAAPTRLDLLADVHAVVETGTAPLRYQFQALQANAGIDMIDRLEVLLLTDGIEGMDLFNGLDSLFDDPEYEGILLGLVTPLYQGIYRVKEGVYENMMNSNGYESQRCCDKKWNDCEADLEKIEGEISSAVDMALAKMYYYRQAIGTVDGPNLVSSARAEFFSAKVLLSSIGIQEDGSYPEVELQDFLSVYGRAVGNLVDGVEKVLEGLLVIYDGDESTDTDVFPYLEVALSEFNSLDCGGIKFFAEKAYLVAELDILMPAWDVVLEAVEKYTSLQEMGARPANLNRLKVLE